jgi:hypothetical protein
MFVQYDQSVFIDHYCQNRFTGGLAEVSQVAVIMHLSGVIKEDSSGSVVVHKLKV